MCCWNNCLRELCKELLGGEISKQQQSSYWGADTLSKNQIKYAANDVLYLHRIKEALDTILENEIGGKLLAEEVHITEEHLRQ